MSDALDRWRQLSIGERREAHRQIDRAMSGAVDCRSDDDECSCCDNKRAFAAASSYALRVALELLEEP